MFLADTLPAITDALTGIALTLATHLAQAASILAQAEGAEQEMTLIQRLFGTGIILPIGLIFLFYLLVWSPERRKRADEAHMMASLKKNDRVVTAGGIHGTIVAVAPDSNIVTVRIDENSNTRIKLNRSSIATVVDANKESRDTKDKERDADANENK